MRYRAIVAAVLLGGTLIPATFAMTDGEVRPQRRWAIVNFERPTKVSTEILMGPYLVVHDDANMARGEPCTDIYPINRPSGWNEATVSFHCIPRVRPVVGRFTIETEWDDALGMYAVKEYQFAGDTEGHGVPLMAALASNEFGSERHVCAVADRTASARAGGSWPSRR